VADATDTPVAPDPDQQRAALVAAALRQKVPQAALDPTCTWQPSMDQAAVTGLSNAQQTSDRYETGGVIYKNSDGNYCYSIPVGNKDPNHFTFGAHSTPDQTIAGIYHTHPAGGGEGGTFSADDVNMASQLKVPSYIKALRANQVKRIDPAAVQQALRSSATHTSDGTLVPQVTPAA
jgi:hypothetical protein